MHKWFTRNFTGRSLTPLEQRFLAELGATLDELRPAQIDAAETAVTAEGTDVLICLIPHRWLGGLSLVAWLDSSHVAIIWAEIGDLTWCHDDLDLGYQVARVSVGSDPNPFDPAVRALREQFERPVILKTDSSRDWAEMGLLGRGGRIRKVARIGKRPGFLSRIFGNTRLEEFTVTFADAHEPPVRIASGAEYWFGTTQ